MSVFPNTFNPLKRIGFVYDVPGQLRSSKEIQFPADAHLEWEDQKTLDKMVEVWQSLGFEILMFPLDNTFLDKWAKYSLSCDLIHSVVEGFGSLARESWIPSLCELSGIPYIGSSPQAQSLSMDKYLLKVLCRQLNIPTSDFYLVHTEEEFLQIPAEFFPEGVFLKPNAEGSGIGIDVSFSICRSKQEALKTCIDLIEKYQQPVLIEKYLSGPEYTSAIIGTPPILLPIAQIEVDDGVYGASNKGKDVMGERVTYPSLNPEIKKIIEDSTKKLFSFLPFADFVRLDWKTDEVGNVYFLEANPLAGLSYYYSPLPLMAKEIGIDYKKLFQILAESAMARAKGRHFWYGKARIQNKI